MNAWPQMIVAGTMVFTIASIANRTRDDEPVERMCAVAGTIVIVAMVAGVLNASGFWDPMIGG